MPFIKNIQSFNLHSNLNLYCIRCYFCIDAYSDDLYAKYNVFCPQTILRAVKKRKAEFLAGRYLSKVLLENAQQPTNVAIGLHRQPVWPSGWIGSITHTSNRACSCIASQTLFTFLGVDWENWIDLKSAEIVADKIVNQREMHLLLRVMPFHHAVIFAFSAKESFFKAVYPTTKHYFDFSSVELCQINYSKYSFTLRVMLDITIDINLGRIFTGQFEIDKNGVFTSIAEK